MGFHALVTLGWCQCFVFFLCPAMVSRIGRGGLRLLPDREAVGVLLPRRGCVSPRGGLLPGSHLLVLFRPAVVRGEAGGSAHRVTSSRSFFKRVLLFYYEDSSCDALAHLAGRGGGEVGKGESAAIGAGGGLWETLKIRLTAALTLRRPCHAAAIQGQKVGRAVLNDELSASFSFLYVRIFASVSAARNSPTQPSVSVPSWDFGGATETLQAAGGSPRLDCVFAVLTRVFVVKVWGHIVISKFLLGLPIKLHPPLD
jgi:hypothetical protein